MKYLLILEEVDWREFKDLAVRDQFVRSYLHLFEYEDKIGYVTEMHRTEFGMLYLKIERIARRSRLLTTMQRLGESQDTEFASYMESLRRDVNRFALIH